MSLSVIIPSKNALNASACVRAVRERDHDVNVVVVDDGLPADWFDLEPIEVIPGEKPFIYARNCNLGIKSTWGMVEVTTHSDTERKWLQAAVDDDIILLNDDALLMTPGGFTAMQKAAQDHPEYGIISATTNLAGNPDQQPRGVGLRDAGNKCVAFVCVLIPRRTIERVGLLDERFTAYGWEDNDYCRRVRNAGLKVGIYDGCYVDHGSLKSTFRGAPHAAGDIRKGMEIYRAKWGDLL